MRQLAFSDGCTEVESCLRSVRGKANPRAGQSMADVPKNFTEARQRRIGGDNFPF